jgi:hypothetical protein
MMKRPRTVHLTGFLAASVFAAGVDAADLTVAAIARGPQVLVSFELVDGLTPEVRDAIRSGLPTTFSYSIELRRRAALIDRTVASLTIAASVQFDNLTRRYRMTRMFDGRFDEARPTEDEDAVRSWLTAFERIPVSGTWALESSGEYYVRVRARTRPPSARLFWPWNRGATLGLAKFTFIP